MQSWHNLFKSKISSSGPVSPNQGDDPANTQQAAALTLFSKLAAARSESGTHHPIVYVYRIDHRNNEIVDRFEQSLKRVGSKRSEPYLCADWRLRSDLNGITAEQMWLSAEVRSTINPGRPDAPLEHAATHASALTGLRVIDMSGMAGQYCGKMFADLGAEVILVEPPGGSSIRREGPFLNDRPHHETSLTFTYFNTGKRGIVLDLDCQAGQMIMRRLVGTADLLIETEKPGVMSARGLDFTTLTSNAPNITVTSITPFGQTGPFAKYEAEDLVMLAIGGLLSLGGYVDTEPVAAYGNQAYLAGAQFGAVASLMALLANERGRANARGRHIDVSIQECVVVALENAAQFFDLENVTRRREAGQQKLAGMGLFPCMDGYIYLMAGGIASSNFWESTIGWFEQEGIEGASQLKEAQWCRHEYLETDEAKHRFESIFAPFAARHTKSYLYSAGQARRIPICPVNTTKDIVENRQLISREFFAEIQHTFSREKLKVPGAPYRLTKTPWCLSRPSPMLGEHTAEVLTELGFRIDAQAALFKAGVLG